MKGPICEYWLIHLWRKLGLRFEHDRIQDRRWMSALYGQNVTIPKMLCHQLDNGIIDTRPHYRCLGPLSLIVSSTQCGKNRDVSISKLLNGRRQDCHRLRTNNLTEQFLLNQHFSPKRIKKGFQCLNMIDKPFVIRKFGRPFKKVFLVPIR